MKYYLFTFLINLLGYNFLTAQSISGNLALLRNQTIKLEGFIGLKTYKISTSTIDAEGNFKLSYSKKDLGMGFLTSANEKPLFVVLSGEEIQINGEALSRTETIKVERGQENQWFEQYAKEYPRREQALTAWAFLEKIYSYDSLFSVHQTPVKNIDQEKQRLTAEDAAFLARLPKSSYVSWFLPVRRLVSSVPTIAQYRTEEIPATIDALRTLDLTDQRLYKSGLLNDAIESHFWLLENCGKPLDSIFIEMKISIDAMMANLVKDEKKLNEVTDFLFDLLERHSLFDASEYLALKVLNEVSCTIDANLAKQLETYRKMKKGAVAPDFAFAGDILQSGMSASLKPKRFYDIHSSNILVVFGASWCPKCGDELPEISKKYLSWKQAGLEVIFVSLDDDQKSFQSFAQGFPFLSYCDYQKWNSPVANAYYVFGTPTMFLLNQKKEIILRPTSVKQVDAWVDWFLMKGNK